MLSDALSFLDDDIIEEAESFRSRKKNYKSIWIKSLSLAACLCIAFMAVFGMMPNADLPLRGEENNISVEDYKYGSGYSPDEWSGGIYFTFTTGSVSYPENTVCLEIKEWKRNSFYAFVVEDFNDVFEDGTRVKVNFGKDVKFINTYDNNYEYEKPTEKDFPTGSRVYVTFSKVRNSFLNSKAEKVIKATEVNIRSGATPLRGPEGKGTTYYIEIKNWEKNAFWGEIKGSVGSGGELDLNTTVKVHVDDNVFVLKQGEEGEYRTPTKKDFPEGTRVAVITKDTEDIGDLGVSDLWIYSISNPKFPQTVLVRISQWNENGFTGTLQGENGRQAFYYAPHTAIVEFTESTRMEIRKDTSTTISLAPAEEDFPVGTLVEVSYYDYIQNSIYETIYKAERIWLYE